MSASGPPQNMRRLLVTTPLVPISDATAKSASPIDENVVGDVLGAHRGHQLFLGRRSTGRLPEEMAAPPGATTP